MKISLNWLSEFLPHVYSAKELDQILTDTGLEVEGFETIESVKGGLNGVIVAEVLTCEQHPNADRLKVTTVQTGKEILQVVCGAPNVAVGQKVLLACVGTTLYPLSGDPLKMKVSKIRDVESYGMLCAEDELGLGQSHDGILVLDPSAAVGTPASVQLELENDTCIEIGLTPNRADAMGHIGVARDVIAYANCHDNKNDVLNLKTLPSIKVTIDKFVEIIIENKDQCPRYVGAVISNVNVQPSPTWLQNKLRAVGISPINNIVDITNYVMRELGTPLHAFDNAFVDGTINIRSAKENEKIVALDGTEYQLISSDIIIANANEALAIAGVFGGEKSGINEKTTNVFLEAAYFQPVSVRKTAKRLGLFTDASFRFERGVDIDLIPYAMNRAINLILELAGGKVSMSPIDNYPTKIFKQNIAFRFSYCESRLGIHIPKEKLKKILQSLDFEIKQENTESFVLGVPNYRVDVDREIDVVEEILRIYGFNAIPIPKKLNASLVVSPKPDKERLLVNLSEMLVGLGFHEIMNNSLSSIKYAEKLGKTQFPSEKNVSILNPLSQDLGVMRQTLIFQMLETIAHNQNRQTTDIKLFEFGTVYSKNESYTENKRLLIAVSGKRFTESWNTSSDKTTLFTIKGIADAVFERLGLSSFLQEETEKHALLKDNFAQRILKSIVGSVGCISNENLKFFGIKQEVFVADLDWDEIIKSLKLVKIQYKELPKFFESRRDFSLLLDQQISFEDLKKTAFSIDKKILKNIALFDVYEGKNVPAGKKSYAVSFIFQDHEQTLKDEQLDSVMQKIRDAYEKQFQAELRS